MVLVMFLQENQFFYLRPTFFIGFGFSRCVSIQYYTMNRQTLIWVTSEKLTQPDNAWQHATHGRTCKIMLKSEGKKWEEMRIWSNLWEEMTRFVRKNDKKPSRHSVRHVSPDSMTVPSTRPGTPKHPLPSWFFAKGIGQGSSRHSKMRGVKTCA